MTRLWFKYQAPRLCVLFQITRIWQLDGSVWPFFFEPQKLAGDRLVPFCEIKSISASSQRKLFPTSSQKVIHLSWGAHVPPWRSGFSMYIWQPHHMAPQIERLAAIIKKTQEERWQLLLVRSSVAPDSVRKLDMCNKESTKAFGYSFPAEMVP